MELDPKLAQKVLDADLANMAKRVNSGKTLTANQRSHFMQVTGKNPLPENGRSKNKVELANVLGVSRQTVYRWAKEKTAPKPNSDGSHNIAEWLSFVRLRSLKGPVADQVKDESNGMDLRDRKMLGQCLKIEAELEILRGNWIPKGFIRRFLEDVFAACRSKILHSQMDQQAKDEVLNELTRLNEQSLGLEDNADRVDVDISGMVSSAEVDGD